MTAVGAVLAGGVSLGACGGAGAGVGLTLYSGQHPQTTAALVRAFEAKTGIMVSVRSEDEDVFAGQIVQEAGNSPADVFYTENSPPLEYLEERQLLARVAPSTLAQVPARYSSPAGRWVGVSARVSVMVYNTAQVPRSQLPTSVLQLADPRWRGKLALAPGETDLLPIVTSVLRAEGEAGATRWLEGLKANARIYPSNEAVTSMVDSGQSAIGLIDQYYWYRERAQVGASAIHSAIAEFAPGDPGYVVDVSGAGVLQSSHHPVDAQRFLAFLVSAPGQAIIGAGDSFEYPLRPGVAAAAGETPLARLRPDPISVGDLGDGSAALALLQKVQLL